MRKQVLSALLATALMLSLLTATTLAAGTTLVVNTPETIPKAGDIFTVTVDIAGNPGFGSVGFTVAYDHSKLECTKIRAGTLLESAMSASNPNAPNGARLGAISVEPVTGDGTLAELTFVAREELSAFGFSLSQARLSDTAGNMLYQSEDVRKPQEPDGQGASTEPAVPPDPKAASISGGKGSTASAYSDVSPAFWGAEWIAEAAKRNLFQGSDDGRFYPDAPITRADYVLVLYRMAGEPEPKDHAPFADVPPDAYYAKAVAWAYEQGYVNGKGDGFAPRDSLTRQEAMKILFCRDGGRSGLEAMLYGVYDRGFADSGEIAAWAKPAMYWAYYKTIITGTGENTLSPTATATRAQLAKLLVVYQDLLSKEESE